MLKLSIRRSRICVLAIVISTPLGTKNVGFCSGWIVWSYFWRSSRSFVGKHEGQRGHEILFLTPKITWPLDKWATKSYFQRPKLHKWATKAYFWRPKLKQWATKAHFRRPKSLGHWSNGPRKSRSAAQNARGRQTFSRPKIEYGRRSVQASPLPIGAAKIFAAQNCIWASKYKSVAHLLGFDIRTSTSRRNHFRRPYNRTSKTVSWAAILSVAQNHFPCSGLHIW